MGGGGRKGVGRGLEGRGDYQVLVSIKDAEGTKVETFKKLAERGGCGEGGGGGVVSGGSLR